VVWEGGGRKAPPYPDWEKTEKMIKPQMTKVIAERHIESTRLDGRCETLIVQVGQPARDPNPGGDWYCPLRIKGASKERLHACFGIDKLQALQFALGLLELEVRVFAGKGQLSWLGKKRLGLRPWTPKPKKVPQPAVPPNGAAAPLVHRNVGLETHETNFFNHQPACSF